NNLEGEFHRTAGGEAGDELAIDDDPAGALNLPGGKLRLYGGMADDFLLRLQPPVGQPRGGRGGGGGDPFDLLEAGGEENQRAPAVRGERFGVISGRWVVEDETETVATAARIR